LTQLEKEEAVGGNGECVNKEEMKEMKGEVGEITLNPLTAEPIETISPTIS
jgi:hypothetical protein